MSTTDTFLRETVLSKYWFDVALAILIVIGYYFPNFARSGGLIKGEITIGYGAVFIIFLGSGLSMKTNSLLENILHWRAHITVFSLEFVITSFIIFQIACLIRSCADPILSDWILAGLIITGCCPTTVSSNVVMTTQADGNTLLTLCEVFLGNLAGTFITPTMVQLYFQGSWKFANPANGTSITEVYRHVFKQIAISVVVPLFLGQVAQNVVPNKTKWFLTTFKINKVGSVMLLLIMYSSFSTAFYQHSFESVSSKSLTFLCTFDVVIYILFTVICYFVSRPCFIKSYFNTEPNDHTSRIYNFSYALFHPFYYTRKDTVSVMLCGGAKTAALGVTLVSSQYGNDHPHLGELLVPLVLYQAIQVITAGLLTPFMKRWIHSDPEYRGPLNLGTDDGNSEAVTSTDYGAII